MTVQVSHENQTDAQRRLAAAGALAFAVALAFALLALPSAAKAETFVVDTNAGGKTIGANKCRPGPAKDCSLHDAVTELADSTDAANTISFRGLGIAERRIELTSVMPVVSKPVVIDGLGTGPKGLRVSGANSYRIFEVGSDIEVTIKEMVLTEGRINSDSAPGGPSPDGGAVLIDDDSEVLIDDVVVSDSLAGSAAGGPGIGGAIATRNGVSLEIANSTLEGNQTRAPTGQGTFGGAIWIGSGGDLTATDSTFAMNLAVGNGSYGGAISTTNGDIDIRRSTLSENRTSGDTDEGSGGAIGLLTQFGAVSLTNSTLELNISGRGGGVYNAGSPNVTIESSTITNNRAFTSGGAIGGGGAITRSILAYNLVNGADDDLDGTYTANNSLIFHRGDATVAGTNNVFDDDPLLGSLRDNGGPTLTRAIGSELSPALDAVTAGGLPTDQRGVGRPKELGRDMGAFELDLAPSVEITNGPTGRTADNNPRFSFSGPERDITGYECSINPSGYSPCSTPYRPGPLADGDYIVRVRSIDQAGNTSPPDRVDFEIDATGPGAQIDMGPRGTTADPTPTFTFSSADTDGDLDGFRCSVDDDAFDACSSPFTASPLSDGDHEFRVRALDDLGNAGTPDRVTFTVNVDDDPDDPDDPGNADDDIDDLDVTVKKRQKQKGKQIKLKVRVSADEAITARGTGKIKAKKPRGKFGLKPVTKSIDGGKATTLRLKLKKNKDRKKVLRAIKKYKQAPRKRKQKLAVKAPIKVVAKDANGNRQVEKRVVTLK